MKTRHNVIKALGHLTITQRILEDPENVPGGVAYIKSDCCGDPHFRAFFDRNIMGLACGTCGYSCVAVHLAPEDTMISIMEEDDE